MSYQALARKWRPRRFSEITGQSHVVRALTNALTFERMHHAYLFTGTRGVGKTTVARILAKALNCEDLNGAEPCCQCQICQAVDAGQFVDLIEVDAASRTKVEDTRELLENAQYAPGLGRYKIYLIDEVHMLSGHSFNALLKTLEEPPPHVKFLLATTDPQKIPVTVLSRCLQFNLKKLLPGQIEARLAHILKEENIPFETGGLRQLSRAADGSLRDALSLLDQAIVFGGGQVKSADVEAMLGGVARASLKGLVESLAAGDAQKVMDEVERLSANAPDFAEVLKELLGLFYRVAVAQQLPETARQDEDSDWLLAQAQTLSPEDVQLFYQIGLMGQKDLPWAPDSRVGLEMVLLRMLAFRPLTPEKNTSQPESPQRVPAAPVPDAGAQTPRDASLTTTETDWPQLVNQLSLPPGAKELAHYCTLETQTEERWVLLLNPQHDHLLTQRRQSGLEKALQAKLDKPVALVIKVAESQQETPAVLRDRRRQAKIKAAEQAIAEDETVQALMETFDAKIVPGSTKPVE